MKEGESKLHNAIKVGTMDQISIAYELMKVVGKLMDSAIGKLSKLAGNKKGV